MASRGANSPTAPTARTDTPNGVRSSPASRRIGSSAPSAVEASATPTNTAPAPGSIRNPNPSPSAIEAAQPKLDLGVLKDLSGKTIMLGVLDLGDPEIESVETVAGRIRNGLKYVSAERLVAAPDCGMKYMPRATAFGKLKAMADAAALVRKEIG